MFDNQSKTRNNKNDPFSKGDPRTFEDGFLLQHVISTEKKMTEQDVKIQTLQKDVSSIANNQREIKKEIQDSRSDIVERLDSNKEHFHEVLGKFAEDINNKLDKKVDKTRYRLLEAFILSSIGAVLYFVFQTFGTEIFNIIKGGRIE